MSWRDSAHPHLAGLTCEHCCRPDKEVIGVASVIAVPYSAAICIECLNRPATVPIWVAEFWLIETGYEGVAEWVLDVEVWDFWRYVPIREWNGWKPLLPAPLENCA